MTARTALLTSTLRVLTLLFPGEEVQAAEEALQKALNMSKNRISLRRVRVWSSTVMIMQNGCKVLCTRRKPERECAGSRHGASPHHLPVSGVSSG